MGKNSRIFSLLIIFLLFCSLAESRDYYFSEHGQNNSDCSSNNPCKDVHVYNNVFYQGDRVYFKNGESFQWSDDEKTSQITFAGYIGEKVALYRFSKNFKMSVMRVGVENPPRNKQLGYRVLKNSSPTEIACTITGGNTICTDTSHSVQFNVGDVLSIRSDNESIVSTIALVGSTFKESHLTDQYFKFDSTSLYGKVNSVTVDVSPQEFLGDTTETGWTTHSGSIYKKTNNTLDSWSSEESGKSEAVNQTQEWKDYWGRLYDKS